LPWSEARHLLFEDAVFYLQESIERANLLVETHNNLDLVIFDRGLLDVAAHLPSGIGQFHQRYGATDEVLSRYDVVIHLVSLAVFDSTKYKEISEARWGKSYFSSIEYAIRIEKTTLDVWPGHKDRFIVAGRGDVDQKIMEVVEIIERVMV